MESTEKPPAAQGQGQIPKAKRSWINRFRSQPSDAAGHRGGAESVEDLENQKIRPAKWCLGILNDPETVEVPGSVLLLSTSDHNAPLGLRNTPARTSASSIPSFRYPPPQPRHKAGTPAEEKKRTADGQIILDPQPDDSLNDPLNWPAWRRDSALLSLGLYCLLGGGMTPVLAAGFNNVAADYHVSIPKVALTTGLYMMGLGVGSVIVSPTAIILGKRPVYLLGAIVFLLSSVWCALSPNYASLVVARVIMGIAVSPCECLPSATIAEIFFLHERAYRVGIYTLLLLGGKNLVPLVAAAIIQRLGWRWVFWIVAIIVGFCFGLLFLFVPETFWDRTPRPKKQRPTLSEQLSSVLHYHHHHRQEPHRKCTGTLGGEMATDAETEKSVPGTPIAPACSGTIAHRRQQRNAHVEFTDGDDKADGDGTTSRKSEDGVQTPLTLSGFGFSHTNSAAASDPPALQSALFPAREEQALSEPSELHHWPCPASHQASLAVTMSDSGAGVRPSTPDLHNFNSPFYEGVQRKDTDYFNKDGEPLESPRRVSRSLRRFTFPLSMKSSSHHRNSASQSRIRSRPATADGVMSPPLPLSMRYTKELQSQPPKSFVQTLKPWNGRLRHEHWFRIAFRPFILFAYPSVLWSTVIYSLSVGWLIVLSESVSEIYRNRETYNFSSLSAGLIYVAPFVGGVLGTAVAGRVSDIIVRYMSRRNGGVYEPEFRLVMAIPIAISTSIGLMGYGWSAQIHDHWIVPTIFFAIISFGCCLGSTTSITFCVDCYRQYAGEALVTMNFSKNIFHGLVFSLFFNRWLAADGARTVFLSLGGIQLFCLLFTIPMYIFGKRARMWTVRRNLMEKF
ncbi:MFS general substrate transporter [Xylona heveae TC161]|uniref:MFS general substrate transporter n=1 Tax=Xylona heveae (strain CBS 132557 / TC161) TaxID=1328760 RepID=A0A165AGS3_XYLHT|nr:MFS general substrate transporter [Xylona heveae TC161]KZF20445.1 MFS general substrate transporter [Xylona heveae TC161]